MSISPAMRLRVVVLPQPDGPTRATNSPSSTSRETRSTATTSPYVLVTSRRVTPAMLISLRYLLGVRADGGINDAILRPAAESSMSVVRRLCRVSSLLGTDDPPDSRLVVRR